MNLQMHKYVKIQILKLTQGEVVYFYTLNHWCSISQKLPPTKNLKNKKINKMHTQSEPDDFIDMFYKIFKKKIIQMSLNFLKEYKRQSCFDDYLWDFCNINAKITGYCIKAEIKS